MDCITRLKPCIDHNSSAKCNTPDIPPVVQSVRIGCPQRRPLLPTVQMQTTGQQPVLRRNPSLQIHDNHSLAKPDVPRNPWLSQQMERSAKYFSVWIDPADTINERWIRSCVLNLDYIGALCIISLCRGLLYSPSWGHIIEFIAQIWIISVTYSECTTIETW